ncbi:hypothetical protein STANM309S_05479 [Streptomyces tanashiensis]
MSTENEGTPVPADPAAPSAPPVPPTPATGPTGETAPQASPQAGPETAPHAAPQADEPTVVQAPVPSAEAPRTGPAPAEAPQAAPAPHPAAEPVTAAAPAGGWPPPPPAVPAWGAPQQPVPGAPGASRRRNGGLVAAVLVAALVAGGIGGGIGYWAAERGDNGFSSTTVSSGQAPASFKRDPGTVAAVAAKALPSVVTIQAKSGGSQEGEGGTGTGFVYDQEGHIVTNNHVVASAADGGTLSVTFSDGKTYDAEVVGRAEGYDVAVLKLKDAPKGLTPLPLGDSDKVAVGDSTIAIGAPFGLSNTVTTGIVSAKNRPVASGDGSGRQQAPSCVPRKRSAENCRTLRPLRRTGGAARSPRPRERRPGAGVYRLVHSLAADSAGPGWFAGIRWASGFATSSTTTGAVGQLPWTWPYFRAVP